MHRPHLRVASCDSVVPNEVAKRLLLHIIEAKLYPTPLGPFRPIGAFVRRRPSRQVSLTALLPRPRKKVGPSRLTAPASASRPPEQAGPDETPSIPFFVDAVAYEGQLLVATLRPAKGSTEPLLQPDPPPAVPLNTRPSVIKAAAVALGYRRPAELLLGVAWPLASRPLEP